MSDKPFKMNTQHIYARDASQDYLKTTPFGADLGSWAFAKNLAEESERNKLHDAKSLLEAAISKDVVKYIDKTFPSIEKAGELGSHSAVKMVGGAVGKFSKVDDFFKMAQHVEQGHGREFGIEGAGA